VDVAKEITKLDGKKEKLNSQLAKLKEAMEVPDYATKVRYAGFCQRRFDSFFNQMICVCFPIFQVPENVQQQNTEKVCRLACLIVFTLRFSHQV